MRVAISVGKKLCSAEALTGLDALTPGISMLQLPSASWVRNPWGSLHCQSTTQ